MGNLTWRTRHSDARTYHDSIYHVTRGPFGGDLMMVEGALCPDGKRRNAYPTTDGTPDTFFSVPAFVHARSNGRTHRIYGYVTIETLQGYSTPTENDPITVKFFPYSYRKYMHLVGGKLDIKTSATKDYGRVSGIGFSRGSVGVGDEIVCQLNYEPVLRVRTYPPGRSFIGPTLQHLIAIEVVTEAGSRWCGAHVAYLGPDHRVHWER